MFENTLSLGNWSWGSNFSAPSLSSPCLGIENGKEGGWPFGVATLHLTWKLGKVLRIREREDLSHWILVEINDIKEALPNKKCTERPKGKIVLGQKTCWRSCRIYRKWRRTGRYEVWPTARVGIIVLIWRVLRRKSFQSRLMQIN